MFKLASKLNALPALHLLSPPMNHLFEEEEQEGFLQCQNLALKCAKEIATHLRPGWSEIQAAKMMETYLRDWGVKNFFHYPFAWWGERTRFEGIKTYAQYSPSQRVLREGEVFILDVAPIYDGYISDIGYSGCLGENEEFDKASTFLAEIKREIPALFLKYQKGSSIWNEIQDWIYEAGYENVHAKYPFAVLGHRVYQNIPEKMDVRFLNFGWQSYWSLLSRGLFGQLLNPHHEGDLLGLWAIEPHLGSKHFGVKFEEILVVQSESSYWLGERNEDE